MRTRTRRFLSAAIAAVAPPLFALGGCSLNAGSGLTPVEARGELYDSLDDTEALVGGSWENRDDPTARGCVIPLWVDGEMYPGLRVGDPPADVDDAVDEVMKAWTDWGFSVEQTLVGEVNELQGHNSYDELMIFRVSSEAMTLQGESECRPV